MRRALLALTATCIAVLSAGCGERHEVTSPHTTQSLSLMLDFFPNADHVGLYQALADGAFKRQGLAVHVQVPADPATPLQLVAAGKVDLAISYEPELLLARAKGLNLVSVGAITQRPLTSIIAIGSKSKRAVANIAGLTGRTVGTAGIAYQSAYLSTILAAAKVDPKTVKQINVGFNLVPAMLTGKVDATLGGFWNYEGVQLQMQHRKPTVIPVDQAGVPPYNELVIVARGEELQRKPQVIRAFLQALGQGYQSVRADPGAGVDALIRANPGLKRPFQLASVRATLPAFFPSNPGRPFGYQDLKQWVAFGRWMTSHGLLDKRPVVSQAATNALLPGQGE
jgi:putative hydroxymethylpyrimidine transport system substrate-binding protein